MKNENSAVNAVTTSPKWIIRGFQKITRVLIVLQLLPIKTTAYGRATLGAKPFRRAPFAKIIDMKD